MSKNSFISPQTKNYYNLLLELTKREFSKSHLGTVGGIIWPLTEPLVILIIYTVFFGVILQGRWGFSGSPLEYGFILFSGLIIFNFFAECFRKFPLLINANPNYVKKIIFPLELLPVVTILSALIHAVIATAIWCAGYAILIGLPKWTFLISPLILLSMIPMLLVIGWIVPVIGLLVKDISKLIGLLTQAFLFLTPIFYGLDIVPENLKFWIRLNPLTFLIEQFRLVLIYGVIPSLRSIAIFILVSSVLAGISYFFFKRIRSTFTDLI